MQIFSRHPFFIRLLHWEYWSFGAVYTWIYPVWFFLCLRSRSFFFFSASNPTIKNGGFLNESKKDICPLIPPQYHPKTLFFDLPANGDIVLQSLRQKGLDFPLIGKPNIGGRGRGIKVLTDEKAVRDYVSTAFLDFHIQEYVSYKKEVGIFYSRLPGETQGRISGIVRKEFLQVTGDGKTTIRNLLAQTSRGIMYKAAVERMHGDSLDAVLAEGESRVLSPYGNHARGALFLDDSNLIDQELTVSIDRICQQIPGFYYGRLDIRFDNWADLKKGEKFYIIEVNGAGSEPTHMYDPRHSLFFAWKEIIRHWVILQRISSANHKKGVPYLSFRQGIAMFREDKEWSRRLAAMPE